MTLEIGSEFWLNETDISYENKNHNWFHLNINHILTSSGRSAISVFLDNIGTHINNKVALLPSYICSSVIDPFLQKGYECLFYDISLNLEPDINSINSYDFNRIGVFLHLGYYGFNTNKIIEPIIQKLNDTKTIVVEDITHTMFSNYDSLSKSKYCVASLRKWLPLPSGGVFISTSPIIEKKYKEHSVYSQIRQEALLIKGKYIISSDYDLKNEYLKLFRNADAILRDDNNCYLIDNVSNNILNNMDIPYLVNKRRSNFNTLLKQIEFNEIIQPVFNSLYEDTCPLFFPVYIKSGRNELRNKLIKKNIYCPIHWPIPQIINTNNYPHSEIIYNHILSIPCDQRYDRMDMEFIAKSILEL